MMKKTWQIVLVAVLAVAALTWLLLPGGGEPSRDEGERSLRARRIREEMRRRHPRKEVRTAQRVPARSQAVREKPVIDLSEAEVEALDELQKKVLVELSEALDANDFSHVRRVLSRMRKLGLERARKAGDGSDWMKHVAKSLRSAAISALGWFGEEALPELAEFLAEPDADLMQDAMTQFELAMDDFTMGDISKAEIIKQVCSTITDEDMTEWMMMEAINARNSVGIDTLTYIFQNGTQIAKSKVFEYLEFFTGEEMQNIQQAEQWLAENPGDPEFDEEMWGPIKE